MIAWTDQEYAEVAEALLWPVSRSNVLTVGPTPTYLYGAHLDARLQQLDEISKARALELARQVRGLVDARVAQATGGAGGCGGNDLAIVQVGDIRFDHSQAYQRGDAMLGEVRGRLAALVDFWINPNAGAAGGGGAAGGISGTWRP